MKLLFDSISKLPINETVGDGAEINDVVNKRDEYEESIQYYNNQLVLVKYNEKIYM
ncbi:hypothetical protein [Staphylococcus epidermidis]|uniref:hypothetical protein n=1 Tax=Staphylococcus epidermidis TaxID=1282 RepID=UPI003907F0A4